MRCGGSLVPMSFSQVAARLGLSVPPSLEHSSSIPCSQLYKAAQSYPCCTAPPSGDDSQTTRGRQYCAFHNALSQRCHWVCPSLLNAEWIGQWRHCFETDSASPQRIMQPQPAHLLMSVSALAHSLRTNCCWFSADTVEWELMQYSMLTAG